MTRADISGKGKELLSFGRHVDGAQNVDFTVLEHRLHFGPRFVVAHVFHADIGVALQKVVEIKAVAAAFAAVDDFVVARGFEVPYADDGNVSRKIRGAERGRKKRTANESDQKRQLRKTTKDVSHREVKPRKNHCAEGTRMQRNQKTNFRTRGDSFVEKSEGRKK